MKPYILSSLFLFLALQSASFAGQCVIHVTRTACAGKEAESYSKCGGKQECDETKKVGSAEACGKEAVKACDNAGARQKITKSKVITAKFDGADVEGGKNFCDAGRPDFNQCN